MPANLTPEFKKAQEWYKNASGDDEKLLALEEMLRTIPKHKGTDHMRADIKQRISKLKTAQQSPKKSGSKHFDIFHVPKGGSGQVTLIGMPNCGKSSIVAALSKAKVNVTDYPFGSDKPVPGMAKHEDVPIEIVDMPPITGDYAPSGMVNTYRNCDIIAIVLDLSTDVLEQMQVCCDYLDSHRLILDESTTRTDDSGNSLARKTFVICTKSDLAQEGTLETLKELIERDFEFIEISSQTGRGLDTLMSRIFEMLDIVRVYAKKPHQPADMTDPFTLPRGSNVNDLAFQVHRELAEKLKSSRIWNSPDYHDGQNVPGDHKLNDKEIIELHFG